MVCSLDTCEVISAAFGGALSKLVGFQVLHQEVLLLGVRSLDLVYDLFGQAVLNPATLYLRNLVVRVGAFDLICPLHLFSLNHQLSSLSLSILSGSK